jgi:hypothetical protein
VQIIIIQRSKILFTKRFPIAIAKISFKAYYFQPSLAENPIYS